MRLLNIHSYAFREFHGENIPPYLIASHRWCDDEVTYKDVRKKRNRESKGWLKVEGFCERARRDNELLESFENAVGCEWIWVDTACIDKSSSAEMSESINSMFEWYSKAQECHAYLADVKPFPATQQLSDVLDDFKNSEWFKRGWTLQELLAPRCVVFFTQNWQVIGHKCADCETSQSCKGAGPLLNDIIAEVTGIPEEVLRDYERGKSLSIEEKIKWQVDRRTTKIEDRAYCLLGLFDVHMPLLYGEGEKAMVRLQRHVFEELERPWRSQLHLLQMNSHEPPDEQSEHKSHGRKRHLRPWRPLAITQYSNVNGEVSCICGFGDDDGTLIACDVCQYWQHAICYYPGTEHQGIRKDQDHGCVKCRPRNLDSIAAKTRQQERRVDPHAGAELAAASLNRPKRRLPSEDEGDTAAGSAAKRPHLNAGASHPGDRTKQHTESSDVGAETAPTVTSDSLPVQQSLWAPAVSPPNMLFEEDPFWLDQLPLDTTQPHYEASQPAEQAVGIDLAEPSWSLLQADSWLDLDLDAGAPGTWTSLSRAYDFATYPSESGEDAHRLDDRQHETASNAPPSTNRFERRLKCPIATCAYHTKGFARESDRKKHMLSHFHGDMICGFCDPIARFGAKTFHRADNFKRHLISVHGAQQTAEPSMCQDSASALADTGKARLESTMGQCSQCHGWFGSAQELHDHLDGCLLRRRPMDIISYTCPHEQCASAGVAFRFRKDLQRHIRARHDESELQTFVCPEPTCARTFTRKDVMLRHRRNIHGTEIKRRE